MPRMIRCDNIGPPRSKRAADLLIKLTVDLGPKSAPRADQEPGWWAVVLTDERAAVPRKARSGFKDGMELITPEGRRWIHPKSIEHLKQFFEPRWDGEIVLGPTFETVIDSMLESLVPRDEIVGQDIRCIALWGMRSRVRLVPCG